MSWCQIVLVPNCPGAKLSSAKLSGVKLSQDLIMVFIIWSFDDDHYRHHDNDGYHDHEWQKWWSLIIDQAYSYAFAYHENYDYHDYAQVWRVLVDLSPEEQVKLIDFT